MLGAPHFSLSNAAGRTEEKLGPYLALPDTEGLAVKAKNHTILAGHIGEKSGMNQQIFRHDTQKHKHKELLKNGWQDGAFALSRVLQSLLGMPAPRLPVLGSSLGSSLKPAPC